MSKAPNPFALTRRNARRLLKKNIAETATNVNSLLAQGYRSINFPSGYGAAAEQMLNEAGGWSAKAIERNIEQWRIVLKPDPAAKRKDDDNPFHAFETVRTKALEHIGKASEGIAHDLEHGVRVFIQPIGIADDIIGLLNETGDWLARPTFRDEDNQMTVRFTVEEIGDDLAPADSTLTERVLDGFVKVTENATKVLADTHAYANDQKARADRLQEELNKNALAPVEMFVDKAGP